MPPTLEEEEEIPADEDTIVVKGEYNWSRPSSPGSMSSEVEPLVANLLAQINTPRNLESPEPLEESNSTTNQALPSSYPQSSQVPSHPTPRPRPRPNIPTMEERLLQMPELRPLPWRDGVEPGADNETGGESRRKQIRFGCLLATRGEVQEVPCNSCANGRGKFNVCVALDGYFKGACASCQLSGRPNRCSIKKNDDEVASPNTNANTTAITPVARPSLNANQQPLSQPPQPSQPSSTGPSAKRRKKNTVPDWESARPQWEQELGDSQARQQMNQIIPVQRPWAPVNAPVSTPSSQAMMNGMNGTGSAPTTIGPGNSMGWATVNQPVATPAPQTFRSGLESNGGSYRNSVGVDQGRRESTVPNEEGSVALIDMLPKNKQRQVYGLVSGLQGGIEHLQRELNSLKRALGIDDED